MRPSLPASYVREVRFLRKERRIGDEDVRYLLGLKVEEVKQEELGLVGGRPAPEEIQRTLWRWLEEVKVRKAMEVRA